MAIKLQRKEFPLKNVVNNENTIYRNCTIHDIYHENLTIIFDPHANTKTNPNSIPPIQPTRLVVLKYHEQENPHKTTRHY